MGGRRHSACPFGREKITETRLRESQSLNRISEIDQLEPKDAETTVANLLYDGKSLLPAAKTFVRGQLPRIVSQSDCSGGEEEKENDAGAPAEGPAITASITIKLDAKPADAIATTSNRKETPKDGKKHKLSKYLDIRKGRFSLPSLKSRLYKAHSCGSLKDQPLCQAFQCHVSEWEQGTDINQNRGDRGSSKSVNAVAASATNGQLPQANGQVANGQPAQANGQPPQANGQHAIGNGQVKGQSTVQIHGVSKRCSLC